MDLSDASLVVAAEALGTRQVFTVTGRTLRPVGFAEYDAAVGDPIDRVRVQQV
jgi:hypothetical protein